MLYLLRFFSGRCFRRRPRGGEGQSDARARRSVRLGHRGSRSHRLPPAGHVPRPDQEHRLQEDREGAHHERPNRCKLLLTHGSGGSVRGMDMGSKFTGRFSALKSFTVLLEGKCTKLWLLTHNSKCTKL